MKRTRWQSGLFLLTAVLLLPAIVFGTMCPQALHGNPSNMSGMKMPMPAGHDHGDGTPSCCVQHHLASNFVAAFDLPSPTVATVAAIAGLAVPEATVSSIRSESAAVSPSPPGLSPTPLRI